MTATETKRYEIGGICVNMTEDQAAAWNRGDVTKEILAGAYVSLGKRSHNLPYEDFVDLWQYIGGDEGESEEFAKYMDGCEAVRC